MEDDVGQSPLQAAHRLEGLFALSAFEVVVVLAGSWKADLDERRDVQGVVQSAVPAAVGAVSFLVAAADVDGGGAAVAGEVVLGPEPSDVPPRRVSGRPR